MSTSGYATVKIAAGQEEEKFAQYAAVLSDMDARMRRPLFRQQTIRVAYKARDLIFEPCELDHAVRLVRLWHSRLPNCQPSPWQYAFRGHLDDMSYVVALWNNPSARTLPGHWLELRRLACSPDSPKNTCSRFLAWMVNWFRKECPHREKCISYQDKEFHSGTIYKASGWIPEFEGKPRLRDRSKARIGTRRDYRSSINGKDADAAGKVRWSIML